VTSIGGRCPIGTTWRLNVADRHDRDATALIFEDHTGTRTQVSWGAVRDRSEPDRRTTARAGSPSGPPGCGIALPTSDTAATYLGVLRTGAVLVTMCALWADQPIRYRLADSGTSILVSEAAHTRRTSDFTVSPSMVGRSRHRGRGHGFRSVGHGGG